ncbi:MAG: glycosyltransferase family 2 protein [Promethearchaeota archaeon]
MRLQPPSLPSENYPFYFLIPTLNEEANIKAVLDKAITQKNLEKIIVIDGGSTDETLSILAEYPIQILHQKGQGKGGAIIEALEYFSPDSRVVMLDGDASYDPGDGEALLPHLKAGVIVNGSRLVTRTKPAGLSTLHFWGNRMLNAIFNRLYRSHITDILSGMKAFIVRDLRCLELQARNFEIEAEIMAKSIQVLQIKEVSIKYSPRFGGQSKLSPFKDGIRILSRLFHEKHNIINIC